MNTKVCVGIATNGSIKTKTAVSVIKLFRKHPSMLLQTWEGCNVHQNRINIVKAAQGKCDYLLFVDGDMVFKDNILETLLAHKKDIVGVATNLRKLPLTSTVKLHDENGVKKWEWRNTLFECQAVGTGLMLIDMKVFGMPQPWFFFEQDDNGDMKTGSDIWFCNQARKHGFRVWCDPTIEVKHIGDYAY